MYLTMLMHLLSRLGRYAHLYMFCLIKTEFILLIERLYVHVDSCNFGCTFNVTYPLALYPNMFDICIHVGYLQMNVTELYLIILYL